MKNIQNQIKQMTANSADIYIYGDIYDSWWDDDNSAVSLKDKLIELGDINEINLHINSLGGDVFEGLAIFNLLKQHKATVNVFIDGIAASIASVIAMAGDTIYMPKNSMMMIHNCWSYACGNSKEFRKLADDLDKIMEASIESYMSKVNITKEELKELLDAETWLTAQECFDKGFADEILPISDDIEQSASKSILDLVKENQNLKMKVKKTEDNQQKITKESIKTIVNESLDKFAKDIEKSYEEILEGFLEGNQKEKPAGLFNKKEDSKPNVFESFFNGILKNEREEN